MGIYSHKHERFASFLRSAAFHSASRSCAHSARTPSGRTIPVASTPPFRRKQQRPRAVGRRAAERSRRAQRKTVQRGADDRGPAQAGGEGQRPDPPDMVPVGAVGPPERPSGVLLPAVEFVRLVDRPRRQRGDAVRIGPPASAASSRSAR